MAAIDLYDTMRYFHVFSLKLGKNAFLEVFVLHYYPAKPHIKKARGHLQHILVCVEVIEGQLS